MGKAIIQSHLGAGCYLIDEQRHVDRALAAVAQMQADVTALEAKSARLKTEISAHEIEYINLSRVESPPTPYATLYALRMEIRGMEQQWRSWELRIAGYNMKILNYQMLASSIRRTAWCADRTEDLSGNVGTIDTDGIPGVPIIQPGWDANAVYDSDRDGLIQQVQAGAPEATFWNLAMLPGWQKWKPTFRIGEITSLDKTDNKATVVLAPGLSGQHPWGKDINVNVEETLPDIPVRYMD